MVRPLVGSFVPDMKKIQVRLLVNALFGTAIICVMAGTATAQEPRDSVKKQTIFSGSVGVTNNGFSIIPTFSFNAPGILTQLSWRWNRFSIDPDIRVTPSGQKGSILLWFRYHFVQHKRFSLRAGAHPAVNWMPTQVVENGESTELIRMRRFLAWELSPSYRITGNWSAGVYYLQGNGLQPSGPQTTHFVNLNTTISNVKLGRDLRFAITPAFYYLNIDGYDGTYFTATAAISHRKYPFALSSIINKTFRSNIPGNRDFMWNVGFSYRFQRTLHG